MAGRTYIIFSSLLGSPEPGGGATFSADIVKEWLVRGGKVHLFGTRYSEVALPGFEPYLSSGMLSFHGLIRPQEIEFGHRTNVRLYEKTRSLIDEIQPDFIHVHNFQGLISGVKAAVESGKPTIYTALDFGLICVTWYLYDGTNWPCSGPEKSKCQECCVRVGRMRTRDAPYHLFGLVKRAFGRPSGLGHRSYFNPKAQRYWHGRAVKSIPLMQSLLKQFTAIIAPSPPVRKKIEEYLERNARVYDLLYPLPSGKVSASESIPEPEPDVSSPLKLVFLGHAHPIKGWPFFLSVLESLPDGLNLEVIDAGGNTLAYRGASRRAKRYLKQSYRCLSTALPGLFSGSDAILVPSIWHENTPLVVLESLANGRPVVASDQAGIANVVRSGKNGFLIKPGDIAEWRKKIIELAENPGVLRAMRIHCGFKRTPKEFVDDLEGVESWASKS